MTGGEPTLRNDICDIIERLSLLNLPDLSMITNGTKLYELSEDLWKSGLRRLNISLNTLSPERFCHIQTGQMIYTEKKSRLVTNDSVLLEKILAGIEKAQSVGFKKLKLNFVCSDKESECELEKIIDFSKKHDCILVVLPVIEKESAYTLEYLYHLIKTMGISREKLIIDTEGIRKRSIYLENGGRILLRVDELADHRPYIFCEECLNRNQCREGIFPIRLGANGKIIPCMAGNPENMIDVNRFIKKRDVDGLRQAFQEIDGWYNVR